MPHLHRFKIATVKRNPFPFNVPAVRYAENIELDNPITFFIGDNGTGKSTLLETIAYRLQLPLLSGGGYPERAFSGAVKLATYLELEYGRNLPAGFFFRAEDFGHYANSVIRRDAELHDQLRELDGEVPDHVLREMKDNANYQLYHVRKEYGEELSLFSHGEAYLKIIQEKINRQGIYLLDEPEAALSPARQLSLIHHLLAHLKTYDSQFIIVTHSPILMALPGAKLYEITEAGMVETEVTETEHFQITKGFLNDPELYLRHLG